ncbi:hypothetical protein F3J29_14485 [Enterobacter sp. Cy-643]|nr:hypothetical protein [Enterobacter sp. Cy-643]
MAITTRVRNVGKILYFLILSLIIGRTIGNPEIWFDHDLATQLGNILYGPGEIGADNFYDLYFYISIITDLSVTILIYFITVKLFRAIRSEC